MTVITLTTIRLCLLSSNTGKVEHYHIRALWTVGRRKGISNPCMETTRTLDFHILLLYAVLPDYNSFYNRECDNSSRANKTGNHTPHTGNTSDSRMKPYTIYIYKTRRMEMSLYVPRSTTNSIIPASRTRCANTYTGTSTASNAAAAIS